MKQIEKVKNGEDLNLLRYGCEKEKKNPRLKTCFYRLM